MLWSESPFILLGRTDQMIEKLQAHRESLGFSYILVSDAFMDLFAAVLEALVGR